MSDKYTFYEVITTCTAKPMGRPKQEASYQDGDYHCFDELRKNFQNIEAVRQYLRDTYGNCKRVKQFIDGEDNQPVHTGYIYCFKNKDYSHDSDPWYQQDWVTIYQTTRETVLL